MALQTNSDTLITVFGGSGFLGRHVVRALAKRRYRIRVAVRRPELAGFLQPLGTVGQIHAVQANLRYPASVEAAVRDASVVDQSGRHPVRARAPALRGASSISAPSRSRSRRHAHRRAHDPCLGDRRRREFALALCAGQGPRRAGGARGLPRRRDRAAVGGVRAGGRFLQPLRRAGARPAGAAADRRRTYPSAAGLCGRCRRSDRQSGRDRRGRRQDLRIRRTGSAHHARDHGIRARGHRALALLVPLPFGLAKMQASVPAIPAEAAADAGSGRIAAQPTMWCRKQRSAIIARCRASASRPPPTRRSCRTISGASARPASSAPAASPDRAGSEADREQQQPDQPTITRHHANSAKP